MRVVLLLAALLGAISFVGCTSAEWSKAKSLGHDHHVQLFSANGQVIKEWDTNGMTHNEENSDGLYFEDKETGNVVRVEGTIIDVQK